MVYICQKSPSFLISKILPINFRLTKIRIQRARVQTVPTAASTPTSMRNRCYWTVTTTSGTPSRSTWIQHQMTNRQAITAANTVVNWRGKIAKLVIARSAQAKCTRWIRSLWSGCMRYRREISLCARLIIESTNTLREMASSVPMPTMKSCSIRSNAICSIFASSPTSSPIQILAM